MSWVWETLPRPNRDASGTYVPNWNSMALFFNLSDGRPADYVTTTIQDARNWLDEGVGSAREPVSRFMAQYWGALSYGRFSFGLTTPRDSAGEPLVPELSAPPSGATTDAGIVELMQACIRANAEVVWQAAGRLTSPAGNRWIPSIVLVHRYAHPIWAWVGFTISVGGVTYEVSRVTHVGHNLPDWNVDVSAPGVGRGIWLTLCHEYAHNFLEFGDLYGPAGCTGYWDLLGDNHAIGRMSEVSSVHKERIGWLRWLGVINGPRSYPGRQTLRPYSTSGDAIKVVPDPVGNPHEYFVLEYRASMGTESWCPGGGVEESGLFITHMNNRFDGPAGWLLREAPYFDPELADFADRGGALWTGWNRVTGAVFGPGRTFDDTTSPASSLYGPRECGLVIGDIEERDGALSFDLSIDCESVVGWTNAPGDTAIAGRFTEPDPTAGGQDIFIRHGGVVALLELKQAQWFVKDRWWSQIDGFRLLPEQREMAVDLDGDGLDELYIRGADTAAVLKWDGTTLRQHTLSSGRIGAWALGPDNWELAVDVDGDGRQELLIRSPQWIGVVALEAGALVLRSIQSDQIDGFALRGDQRAHVGRFTRNDRSQVLVRGDRTLAILDWSPAGFTAATVHDVAVDTWTLGRADRECVGDFDGDGFDELFVQAGNQAAVLKWGVDGPAVAWGVTGTITRRLDGMPGVSLSGNDRLYPATFQTGKDGVLHRQGGQLAVMTWESGGMKARAILQSPFRDRWRLQDTDLLVTGDFHRTGLEWDLPSPSNYIFDRFTDAFLHNGRDTAMVGFTNPDPDDPPVGGRDEFDICWHAPQQLLFRVAPPMIAEPDDGRGLAHGFIVGNLADGGYIIFRPGQEPVPGGGWDPTTIEAVRQIHANLHDPMVELAKLGLRQLIAKDGSTEAVLAAAKDLDDVSAKIAVGASHEVSSAVADTAKLGLELVVSHKGWAAAEGYFPPEPNKLADA